MTISAADEKTFILSDEIIDHMPVQSALPFTGNFLTIVAASMAFGALCLLTADAGHLFADALTLHDYATCLRLIALYAPIYFLMFGAASYLATRYGLFARTDKYINRKHEACIERIYGRNAPALVILVPSYKEEEEIIRQTLLSAALVEYPQKLVVLLLDDPPYSTSADDQRKRSAAHKIISELTSLFREPAETLKSEQVLFRQRLSDGPLDPIFELSHLAHLYGEVSHWIERQAEPFLQGRSSKPLACADRFFLENILLAPARAYEAKSRSLLKSESDVDFGIEYCRLAGLFDVTISAFERKKYVNLSHAPNKAMNLNSYIGLVGKHFVEVQQVDGLWLKRASEADATLSVPAADYIINLDADTLLLSDYALRLVDIMEEPGNERLAVAQTPYSAYPEAPSMLERIAGATTDVQYLTHQGMTFFDATAWVGANALIRRSALDDIMTYCHERGHRLPIYIQDTTLIEDTAASIDLINKRWQLYNYPARLAYSATPPDFGSLLIQRRRWANGGLLIFPNLVRYAFQTPLSFKRLAEGFVRTNYLLSPAFVSVGMMVLLICSFDDYMFSIWVPLTAIPYQIVYCCDLTIAGYKRRDLPRVYALNMMLIPVYVGGTLQSLRQAFTGVKAPFVRTPKVAGRTSTQLLYLLSLYGILIWCLFVFVNDVVGGRLFHMVFTSLNSAAYLYGISLFIGVRESWEDLFVYVKLLSPKREASIGDAESISTTGSEGHIRRQLRITYGGDSHWNVGFGMGLHQAKDVESRFTRYVEGLVSVIGHADRAGPLHDYCLGLVMPCERKSVEPMAAITAPERTAMQHQSLLHFVGDGSWSDEAVLGKVREMVLPKIERYGPIEAWLIDDTSFPKRGQHSVGMSHQYCGQLGKQANCQVAVALSLANHDASPPGAYRLYLPKPWAEDDVRRRKAKMPENIAFKTKPEIALDQIRRARENGLPGRMVLLDAGYCNDSKLRAGITELGLAYVAGIQPQTLVWKPGVRPGLPPKKGRRDAPKTTSVKNLALGLRARAWRTIKLREGTNEWLSSRFARVRVHVASSHERPGKPIKEWLLIEWPEGEDAPTRYWLSTLPSTITFCDLVDAAKLRWRIERDYEELRAGRVR